MAKSKPTIGKTKKKIDKLWSKAVRERDNYTCRKCGKYHKQTQAAHIFGRSRMSTRYDMDNGITLCYYCHIHWAHRNIFDFADWVEEQLGEEKFKTLRTKSEKIKQYTIAELEKVGKQLKAKAEEYASGNW